MRWIRPWFALAFAVVAIASCRPGSIGGARNDDDPSEDDDGTSDGGAQGHSSLDASSEGGAGGDVADAASATGGSGAAIGSGGAAGMGMMGGSSAGMRGSGGVAGSTGMAGATGMAGMTAAAGNGGGMPNIGTPPAWKPTVMAIGYGGMRVATQNNGVTWKKVGQLTRDGGDDPQLLRAVAFGKNRWIAAGWRMFTSGDGSTWMEGKNPEGCGLMEGAAFGNGVFVGTCGEQAYLSDDGLTWRRGGRVGSTNGHTYVLFANGVFAASGDSGNSYRSTDGITWTALSGVRKVKLCDNEFRSETACAGDAWFANTFYRGVWKGKIERSATGATWAATYTDDWANSVYRFGSGMMPPLE